jgi:hypothetical protein
VPKVPAVKEIGAVENLEDYGLTRVQTRLLDVLRDPKSMLFTAEQISKQANITRGSYYNSFKDQKFVQALELEMASYRSAHDFAVMHHLVEEAKTSKNEKMIALFERLQNRLKEGGERPAQIILVFEGVERPAKLKAMRIIEGEAEVVKDADSGSVQTVTPR